MSDTIIYSHVHLVSIDKRRLSVISHLTSLSIVKDCKCDWVNRLFSCAIDARHLIERSRCHAKTQSTVSPSLSPSLAAWRVMHHHHWQSHHQVYLKLSKLSTWVSGMQETRQRQRKRKKKEQATECGQTFHMSMWQIFTDTLGQSEWLASRDYETTCIKSDHQTYMLRNRCLIQSKLIRLKDRSIQLSNCMWNEKKDRCENIYSRRKMIGRHHMTLLVAFWRLQNIIETMENITVTRILYVRRWCRIWRHMRKDARMTSGASLELAGRVHTYSRAQVAIYWRRLTFDSAAWVKCTRSKPAARAFT